MTRRHFIGLIAATAVGVILPCQATEEPQSDYASVTWVVGDSLEITNNSDLPIWVSLDHGHVNVYPVSARSSVTILTRNGQSHVRLLT